MSLDAICTYYSYVLNVDILMKPSLSTFQELLNHVEGTGVTMAEFDPYSGQASPQARRLLCWTFCSHISLALLASVFDVAYTALMFISLEVWFSGECKFIWFFQICNITNEHSFIFPVPDGTAHMIGSLDTMAANNLDFNQLWNNLSTYIVPSTEGSKCTGKVPSNMNVLVYHLVPPRLHDISLRLLGQTCPSCDVNNNPNNCLASCHQLIAKPTGP